MNVLKPVNGLHSFRPPEQEQIMDNFYLQMFANENNPNLNVQTTETNYPGNVLTT